VINDDLKNLLRGFMVHIGMGITDQLNMDEIESFNEASLRCADVVKNQKQIERLQIDLKVMTGQRNSLAGRVIKERERSIRLAEAMCKMREEFKANKEVYSRIHDIVHGTETLKHLTLQDLIKQKNEE